MGWLAVGGGRRGHYAAGAGVLLASAGPMV